MRTYIGLLRGINVGGRNKLPMADLRDIFNSIGLDQVETYIQSGNIVFRSEDDLTGVAGKIESCIESRFGFRPRLLILTAEDIRVAAAKYPFPVTEPKFAHLMFLERQPDDEAIDRLVGLDHAPDKIHVGAGVVHIYFPNGVSGSKIDLGRIERTLGVSGTARNWRTVQKLLSMAS